ncbi:hypothetical protein BLA24_12135 [Streptomyces cinnamoneus]|uniref:Uncharacterized protein n=1 Tax=Streptomyces cinnamoneus TaxID=53446 RepID=A0A2G1XKX0_STRCJ|nr:hypothetical protein BLA24_12135 [Streptomyces cinnamoneus]PPT12068.1 hypothetical protein CYQ11_03375 [Streptomyces cinnamoneus]
MRPRTGACGRARVSPPASLRSSPVRAGAPRHPEDGGPSGPRGCSSAYKLHRRTAILEGPGEAQRIDGGGGTGWRTPG